jgi:hypothetical protein
VGTSFLVAVASAESHVVEGTKDVVMDIALVVVKDEACLVEGNCVLLLWHIQVDSTMMADSCDGNEACCTEVVGVGARTERHQH